MSKVLNELLPEDFEKPIDVQAFDEWKQKKKEHANASFFVIFLQVLGLVAIIVLGGIVGLVLIFAALFTGMFISLSKQKAVKNCQKVLGVTNDEIWAALHVRRKKMKQK